MRKRAHFERHRGREHQGPGGAEAELTMDNSFEDGDPKQQEVLMLNKTRLALLVALLALPRVSLAADESAAECVDVSAPSARSSLTTANGPN